MFVSKGHSRIKGLANIALINLLHKERPVFDTCSHVPAEDEVKRRLRQPWGFDIVNDKLYVWGNPEHVLSQSSLEKSKPGILSSYHGGCIAERSFPMTCSTVSRRLPQLQKGGMHASRLGYSSPMAKLPIRISGEQNSTRG